jgi:hypothetical protein
LLRCAAIPLQGKLFHDFTFETPVLTFAFWAPCSDADDVPGCLSRHSVKLFPKLYTKNSQVCRDNLAYAPSF